MKEHSGRILLSVAALLFSVLSAALGFGLLGSMTGGRWFEILCGFCFIAAPLLVIQLVLELFKKER